MIIRKSSKVIFYDITADDVKVQIVAEKRLLSLITTPSPSSSIYFSHILGLLMQLLSMLPIALQWNHTFVVETSLVLWAIRWSQNRANWVCLLLALLFSRHVWECFLPPNLDPTNQRSKTLFVSSSSFFSAPSSHCFSFRPPALTPSFVGDPLSQEIPGPIVERWKTSNFLYPREDCQLYSKILRWARLFGGRDPHDEPYCWRSCSQAVWDFP